MRVRFQLIIVLLFCQILGFVHAEEAPYILLQSTTSTKNSGLYDHILPIFKNKTGIDVRVVAVGTGQALRNAKNGDADVLLVHARSEEEKFIQDGYGVERFNVMYNDFIIVGPKDDPAKIVGLEDVTMALRKISDSKVAFVSRGDNSGTHIKELSLWQMVGIDIISESGSWYRETGSGMGATLNTAVAMQAYTLTDRSTWISFGNKANFKIMVQNSPPMYNQYGVIIVNPEKHPHVKYDLSKQFLDWLLSNAGQSAIGDYQVQGQQLFFPNGSS